MKADAALKEKSSSRPRGRPKSASRLEEVLKCAAAMFSARGYASASLEDIAAQLGMTRAALYYYATSKEDLLAKCYDWNYTTFMSRVSNELGEGTGLELLSRFFLIYSEAICNDFSRCFLASDDHYLQPKDRRQAAARLQGINVIVSDILDRGALDGTLLKVDNRWAIVTLFGAFNTLHKVVRPSGPTPQDAGKAVLAIVLQGLLPRD